MRCEFLEVLPGQKTVRPTAGLAAPCNCSTLHRKVNPPAGASRIVPTTSGGVREELVPFVARSPGCARGAVRFSSHELPPWLPARPSNGPRGGRLDHFFVTVRAHHEEPEHLVEYVRDRLVFILRGRLPPRWAEGYCPIPSLCSVLARKVRGRRQAVRSPRRVPRRVRWRLPVNARGCPPPEFISSR